MGPVKARPEGFTSWDKARVKEGSIQQILKSLGFKLFVAPLSAFGVCRRLSVCLHEQLLRVSMLL